MGTKTANAAMWHPNEVILIGLTLIASAIHFADNAFRLDLYPGPAWLTRNVVLTAWIAMLFAACLAYWINTRIALIAYGGTRFRRPRALCHASSEKYANALHAHNRRGGYLISALDCLCLTPV
jgi:hypothetical protein